MSKIEYRKKSDQQIDHEAERHLPAPEANPEFDLFDPRFTAMVDKRFQKGIAKGEVMAAVEANAAKHAWGDRRVREGLPPRYKYDMGSV